MSVGGVCLTSPLPQSCQLPWPPPRRHLHLDIYSPYISWHCMSNRPDAARHKYLRLHTDRCGVTMYRHDFSETTFGYAMSIFYPVTFKLLFHDDVIKWKHFPRHRPFVRGIHRSPHNGQWRGALMFSLIYVWINGRVNNGEIIDLRRYRVHYDATVMWCQSR